MMHVTLRQLQAFETVARLRSFSRAADELFITQPAVSKQIRLLNEQVGMPLVEVLGKQVFLTPAGEELYATCANWFETWGRFEQSIANMKGLKEGRLKITSVTTTGYFMPRILGPFCAQYPGVDVALEVVNRDRLLDRMAANLDDLYVMGVPPEGLNIISEPFMENPIVVVAPVGHRLVGQKDIPLSELANENFLMRERGSGTRIAMERMFAEHNVPVRIRMELGSNEAIKQAVAGGLGLAILSQSTLERDSAGLEVLDVRGFPIHRDWYVVLPKGKQLSVVAEAFLRFLLDHVQILSSAPPEPAYRGGSGPGG